MLPFVDDRYPPAIAFVIRESAPLAVLFELGRCRSPLFGIGGGTVVGRLIAGDRPPPAR